MISLLGQATSKYAVNLQPNPIQFGYYGAAGLLTNIGKGNANVLDVDGIPGLSIDTGINIGANAVFKACQTDIVGNLVGEFDPTIAKTQVLTFLSAHPGTVDGVFQVSDMAPGIFSAFSQVGRKVPPVDDIVRPGRIAGVLEGEQRHGIQGERPSRSPPTDRSATYSLARGHRDASRVAVSRSPTCRTHRRWSRLQTSTSGSTGLDGVN